MKAIKGKTLGVEIDKIHGLEPSLHRWTDAKFLNIRKSSGSTQAIGSEKSSVDVLRRRIESLEKCSTQRTKEVAAIKELSVNIMDSMNKKFDLLVQRIDMKAYQKCGRKFDEAEIRIMKVLRDEL